MTAAAPRRHLTYCTNIHAGETWDEVRANLARFVVPVRERFAPGRSFGLGLRLSGEAARTLAAPDGAALAELRAFLAAYDLYVFTINGFPYGPFHGRPVKEQVYRPDWLEPERLAYTDTLADLLAALLPEGVDGTISTVPGAFAPRVAGDDGAGRIAGAMAAHVAHLLRVRAATGRVIALAVEPEPCCFLETIAETVDFFERHVFGAATVAALAERAGIARAAAADALRAHVGVCVDACHMAVEFEDPAAALDALARAGIRVAKVQVSAGLRVALRGDDGDTATLGALGAFADDVYLHQVVERRADGRLARHVDLPQALAAARGERDAGPREWRVHFHVPLFRDRFGPFDGTQGYAAALVERARDTTACGHYEVETYTWDVLPDEFRGEGIVGSVVRELEWARPIVAG